jgi:hypothetical protein
VFLVTFAVCAAVLASKRPVGRYFLPDEWYLRGVNLRLYGTLGQGERPLTFRPPGYPAFIAAVLATLTPAVVPEPGAAAGNARLLNRAYGEDGPTAVYLAQGLLLAATAALLYLWSATYLPGGLALLAALLFGTNPYGVITALTLHYDVLHLFGLVAGCFALDRALRARRRPLLALWLAGVCWGLVCLVRPISLILPPFVFLLALAVPRLGPLAAARAAAVFTLGMAVTIAPWTVRNYRVADRLISVNSQGWVALWAATVEKLPRDPDHLRWHSVWMSPERLEVERSVRPKGFVNYPHGLGFNLALEDAFRARALSNLRTKPEVYLHNVAVSFLSFNVDFDSVLIKVYEYVQRPDFNGMPVGWYASGHPQDFHSSDHARAFVRFTAVLGVLAAWGVGAALWRRDRALALPGLVYLSVCAAHALTWMDLRYYYVKLPFLFLFAFYGVAAGGRWRRSATWLAAGPLAAWGAWLTAVVFL